MSSRALRPLRPLRPPPVDIRALTVAAEQAWHEEGWAAYELAEVVHAEARRLGARVPASVAARIAREVARTAPRRAG